MATPTQKIRAGIDRIDAAKSMPGTPRLAALAAAPSSIPSLFEITGKVTKARKRIHKLRDASAQAVKEQTEKITAEYAERGWQENDNGKGRVDILGATKRQRLMEGEVLRFRKAENAATVEERNELLTELRQARQTLNLVRTTWSSPLAILMRSTLGSEKRAIYNRNLEAEGPTALANAMSEAVATGDKELAAACCSRFDSIGNEGQKLVRFSKDDVAEVIAGDDWNKAQEALGLADYAIASGELAEKEINGLKIAPTEKIKVGMIRDELEAKLGRSLDGPPKEETFEERLDRLYPGGPLPEGYSYVDLESGQ